jgi:enoyl-CoA hydratase/carnithine racemase
MSGSVALAISASVASVTLSHPGKFNAMSRGMWRELRCVFENLQISPDVRCVVVAGENGNFCAGGDISQYADFRFHETSLREFHETDVWGALQAMLGCDLPIVARIEGNCMGAGIEIASCCDIRLAGISARFGAPIARLGFPMAPREAELVAREVGLVTVRQMLLEALIFSAADMKAAGFISRVLADQELADEAQATAMRIEALAPQAARLNKRTLRAFISPLSVAGTERAIVEPMATDSHNSFAYADSVEHREGISAFLEKRQPAF